MKAALSMIQKVLPHRENGLQCSNDPEIFLSGPKKVLHTTKVSPNNLTQTSAPYKNSSCFSIGGGVDQGLPFCCPTVNTVISS